MRPSIRVLIYFILSQQFAAYWVIFFGLIFEGEITLITTGVFLHLGALSLPIALYVICSGAIIKTFSGYYIGEHLNKRYPTNKILKYIEKKVSLVMPQFRKKPFWSIFASKFLMGANYVVIIFAGYKRINLKTYLKAEALSTVIWIPLMLSLGYFFSYTALHVSREIWRFSLIILALVVSFVVLDKLIGWLYEVLEEHTEKE
jgi:membrane protein DedA with SNARE-associated domain